MKTCKKWPHPPPKRQDRRNQRDIREALGTVTSREKPSMQPVQPEQQEHEPGTHRHEQEQETDPHRQESQAHPHYGQEVTEGELVDWDTIFKEHMEETRRINKEREEKIEKAQKERKKAGSF